MKMENNAIHANYMIVNKVVIVTESVVLRRGATTK